MTDILGRLSTSVYWTLRLPEGEERTMCGPVPAVGEKIVLANPPAVATAGKVLDVIWVYQGDNRGYDVSRAEVIVAIIKDPT